MSKSLKRVKAQAEMLGLFIEVREMTVTTKTAQEAADAISVHVDQIAKSIIFRGAETGRAHLFVTAGGNRVDPHKAALLAGEAMARADAAFIRAETGFAIGGVSPIGHIKPVAAYFDDRLAEFKTIWAAAGTPNHMFEIEPSRLATAINAKQSDFTQ